MIPKLRRALVTGADGFLGCHLLRELERYGVRVTGLTRRARPDNRFVAMGSAPWRVDCLARILEMAEPDVVFHLAGGAAGSPAELEQLNLGLTRTLMAALSRGQARPVLVCCGSAAEYGSAHIDGVPTPETARCAPESAFMARVSSPRQRRRWPSESRAARGYRSPGFSIRSARACRATSRSANSRAR